MKRALTLLAAGLGLAATASGQARFGLYEEFSGENCGPCAASNPGLWTLMQANTSKVLLIKYQSPIPSAGPIYYQNTADVQSRLTYYSVPFAPYGRLNGTNLGTGTAAPSSPGHIANLTQNDINTAYAATAPFTISVTHNWSTDGDSVYASATINATQAFAPAGANMVLRAALVESLYYTAPPGTNGETEFHNVVRKMYPSPAGTPVANSWTNGQSQTVNISGPAPSYMDKTGTVFMVVWLQNETDKVIQQAAKSNMVTIPLEVKATAPDAGLACATGATNVTPVVTLKNNGTTTITSAQIQYRLNSGTAQTFSWTGSLAANATTNVSLPTVSAPLGGNFILDSVISINGSADINPVNNGARQAVYVHNTTTNNLPYTTNFGSSATVPTGWTLASMDGDAQNWTMTNLGATLGYALKHDNYNYPAGEINYAIIANSNLTASGDSLRFDVAHAQYSASYSDVLDVVYSTNCGSSWNTIYNKAGAALATTAATTAAFTPASASAFRRETVSLASVPAGSLIAFRATSDYGNNLYIDNVDIRVGPAPAGVADVVANAATRLSPNPARETATLEFTLTTATTVRVDVVDMAGRLVQAGADMKLAAGSQKTTINTATLPAGLYMVRLQTEQGAINERLTVVK